MSVKTLPASRQSTIPAYKPPYDTSHFVNTGEFFDKNPGVTPWVTRYEAVSLNGDIIETWERDKNGVMVNVTARDKYRKELIEAQEELARLQEV